MTKGLATRRLRHALRQAQAARGPVPAPRLSRRRLLGTALAAGGLGLAPRLALGRTGDPRVAIVGAGIAGLNAAWQLRKHGLEATVYEARGRVGGRMLSRVGLVEPGIVDDLGGSLVNTDHADLRALLEEFGLGLHDRRTDPLGQGVRGTAWFVDGRLVGEAEIADGLRPIAQQIVADAERVDADFDRLAPRFDGLTAKAYLDQHVGLIPAPFARRLLENAIRTEYGAEPERSSALQLLFLLPTVRGADVELLAYSDEAYVVREGSGRLPERIAAQLGERVVRLGMPLVGLADAGAGYELTFAGGAGGTAQRVRADLVILALPFPTLRRVKLALPLPALLRRCIDEVGLGRNEKVFAGYGERVWRREDGLTVEFWADDSLDFPLVWEDSQRQPEQGHGVLNFFVGGDQVAPVLAGGIAEIGRRFVAQLDQALPGMAASATGNYLRTRWTRERYTRGAYTNLAPGQYTGFAAYRWIEAEDPGERVEVGFGNLLFAGEHTSDEHYGFMNGAAQTGRLAAEAALRRLAA
jgi:monoamine oxidase